MSFALMVSNTVARAGGRAVEGVLNLNTAPVELLALLPGIGPAKARAILAYRMRRSFRTVDELVRVKGIGRRMVREMRPHLAIAGPSTAHGVPGQPSVELSPVLRPMVPPAVARQTCRPVPVASLHLAPPRTRGGTPAARVTSPANHCAPPA